MDLSLGSGDTQTYMEDKHPTQLDDNLNDAVQDEEQGDKPVKLSAQTIEDNETKLKNRIDQCRSVLESLKLELNEEKAKFEKDTKEKEKDSLPPYWSLELEEEKAKLERDNQHPYPTSRFTDDFVNSTPGISSSTFYNLSSSNDFLGDLSMYTNIYSACVESKLNCDENLMEYERQLEKYQTTLNRAQAEKKNAIRKRMLTKAYKLKLMELENQCNIELLRVKQSLQCLEPLQMIVNQWKIGSDEEKYNLDKFELMPSYPEISAASSIGIEVKDVKDEPTGSGDFDVLDNSTSE